MSELESAEPDQMAFVEYQLVRMNGAVLVSFLSPLSSALYWIPAAGMEIWDACAGRYRVLPDGPWIVRAYYPEGFPGPQGEWPEGAELTGIPQAITS